MSKQYALATIQFQANARQANAAIESLRQESVKANDAVVRLKKEMKQGLTVGKYNGEELPIAQAIRKAEKDLNAYKAALKELTKGTQAFESVVKNMRAGTLEENNAAELKAAQKAAELRISRLRETDKDYATKRADLEKVIEVTNARMKELTANVDAFYRRFKSGAVTSISELEKQKKAMSELLATMDAGSKEYQRLEQQIASVDARIKELGGDYRFIRENISDTQKVSDDMLVNMLKNLQQVNNEGRVTQKTLRENAKIMREIRAEQASRVQNVLGGDLGKQKEGDIRRAISIAKELIQTYGSTSRKAQELAAQIVNAEEHLKTVGVEAARNAQREKQALAEQAQKEKDLKDLMTQRMQNLKNLTEGGLAETKKYWQAQMDGATKSSQAFKEAEKNLRLINAEQERLAKVQMQKSAARISRKNLATLSEQEVTESIKAAKQLAASMKPTEQAYKDLTANIIRAEEHVKKFGLEGQRSAHQTAMQLQTMRNHMQNLTNLSAAALSETQKYWQAQLDGATRGSKAYREAERNLKAINAEQERLTNAQLQASANKLGRANLKTLSGQDLQSSINAAKQLLATMKPTNQAYKDLQNNILRAEEFSKQFGLEAARAAQQAAAKMQMMNDRMSDLKALSAGALEETKRFWQAQMDGATRGSQAYTEAETHIKNIIAEQERLAAAQAKTDAQKIYGNKMLMSEGAIRNAIDAAKQYQQTLSATNPEYKRLSTAIVDAEEHIKKYGVEAERTARKEAAAIADAARKRQETDTMMRRQLYNQTNLSQSALKAQEQYWQRLIDDPKTAQASIARYTRDLQKVKQLQEQMVQQQGQSALAFFRGNTSNASTAQIQEQAKALKAYRDSLPQQANAQVIAEIDSYLVQAGQAAQKAAEQTMSFKQALQISQTAGKGQFKGTVEQLTQAKKVLEEMQQRALKGGYAWKRMQEGIDKINLELKETSFISKEVQSILDQPKGRSFNELKVAVEQGRAALANMRTDTEKGKKAFDELAAKVKVADQEMKTLGNSSKGTATSFDKAWSRLKTYIGLYMGAAVAMQKLVGVMSDLTELSDKMGEVRKTTGFTADEVGRLSNNLKKMDVRTSLVELMEVSASAGQLGLKTLEDVQGFTEAANKLMVALPEMGKEAATEMMRVAIATGEVDKIRKQMQEGTIEGSSATAVAMEKIASTIDRLRATSASTAPEITDFVKRVGAVGAQSGITIDQVSALGSTISSLGMRVEMSATALSRMIPAIKNNAFDIARAIGVTPNTIRELFDAGRGMEAILMILQHMKDANMDEDSIEAMMGMGGMRDIMKDLNQQGARAGIVFAGLSQNVDELRRQLGVANQAYEENIAIQQEFDKMNQTTAARWERLKNQIEEMFVGDKAQRFLGNIIDGLRAIADFISSNGPIATGLKYIILLWSAFKLGVGQGLLINLPKALGALTASLSRFFSIALIGLGNMATKLGIVTASTRLARMEWKKLDLAMKQNIFGMIAAAILYAIHKLIEWRQKVAEARKEIGEMAHEMVKAEEGVKKNFKAVEQANAAIAIATTKLYQARKELDAAKKAMDGSKESAERLANAEKNLKEKEDQLRIAQDKRRSAIETINKLYGSYLGFLLSETAQYGELKNAIELVNNKLREGIILRRKEAAISKVEGESSEDRDVAYGALSEQVRGLYLTKQKVNGKETLVSNTEANEKLLKNLTRLAQDEKFAVLTYTEQQKKIRELLKGTGYESGGQISETVIGRTIDYAKKYQKVQKKVNDVASQYDVMAEGYRAESKEGLSRQFDEGRKTWSSLQGKYIKATGEDKKKAAAELLKQDDELQSIIAAAPNYYNLNNEQEKADYDNLVKDMENRRKSIADKRESLIKEAGSYYTPKTGGGGGGTNPWGSKQPAESTNYYDMNAEELVTRRKQMKDFVNAIQTDSDVKSVLAEDKALKKAIENGMSSDMRTVIEWYNTERLKIQDELNARHLTNTGDWKDPKKERARKKRLQDDMKAYLEELDAYYTERKAKIQEARNNEEISEAEAWNRDIANESEWHRRRAELQKLYADKAAEVTQEEQDAIYNIIAERTEDSIDFIKKTVGQTVKFSKQIRDANEQGAKEYRKFQGDLQLGWEKDFLKQRQALGKHLKAIEDIVNKERPFNGIAKNLQDNLGKMGILTADLGDDALSAAEELKRVTFLLGESENAYTMTVEQLLDDMRQKGFREWADVVSKDTSMQQGLLAMLRQTFDSVQDAIKKESSIIKKQVEIMLEDINNQVQKDDTQLKILENSVRRANSLIGAGAASERVADKLAIKQIQMQITLQETKLRMLQKRGNDAVKLLKQEADLAEKEGKLEEAKQKRMDAENVAKSVGLTLSKDQVELDKQRVALAEKLEETQNRLYTQLREWGDLLTSSVKELMEASNAGNAEYYNERAKLELTGKGGPGAGTYIIIDNAGTEDAEAHYEYLDERQALERQHEIEQQNAQADAWRKVMDDLNQKMNDSITDWMNAYLQNQSIDANTAALNIETEATNLNTEATKQLTDAIGSGLKVDITSGNGNADGMGRQFRVSAEDRDMIDKVAALNDVELKDKRFRVTVDSMDTMKKLMEMQDVEIPDKTFTVKFNSEKAIKEFQKANGLKDDGIIGPKTLEKMESMGITKIDDKTFQIKADDTQAINTFKKINGVTLSNKTVSVKTDSNAAEDDLQKLQDAEIPEKVITVKFDSKQAVKDFQKMNKLPEVGTIGPRTTAKLKAMGATKVSDETFKVNADNRQAIDSLSKIQGVTLQNKTIDIIVRDSRALKQVKDMDGLRIENKTFDVVAKTDAAAKDIAAIGAMQIPDKRLKVIVDQEEGVHDDVSAFAYGKQNFAGGTPEKTSMLPDSVQGDVDAFAYGKQNLAGGIEEQENTDATNANTQALNALTQAIGGQPAESVPDAAMEFAQGKQGYSANAGQEEVSVLPENIQDDVAAFAFGKQNLSDGSIPELSDQANTDATNANTQALNANTQALNGQATDAAGVSGLGDAVADVATGGGGSELSPEAEKKIVESKKVAEEQKKDSEDVTNTALLGDKKMAKSSQSTFAKMIQSTNLFGAAYQAMSNDNLDTAQKFEMIALQAVGNAAIAGLQVALSSSTAETAAAMPAAAAKSSAQAGPIAGPILFAVLSALVGGLMGLAASKISKSKSQISQVTGASVNAGRLSTGMLTYAEGNVNEFTDPNTLTPGRHYNVDGADGKTYRAKYMGKDAKTHITNGPEFHLVGEKGREAIIDAHTTRLMQMDDTGIWQSIQMLYNGGSLRNVSRRSLRRGIPAFADGNLDDFESMGDGDMMMDAGGSGSEQMAAFQNSLDRNNDLLEQLLVKGVKGHFDVYGKGGLVDSYDTGKKTVTRHGERY